MSLVPMGGGWVNGETMLWATAPWYDARRGQQIPVGEWTHVAFTVDAGEVDVYINGVTAFSGTGFPDVFTTTTGAFALGVNWWDTPFDGAVDELKVYTEALDAEQVAALAAAH